MRECVTNLASHESRFLKGPGRFQADLALGVKKGGKRLARKKVQPVQISYIQGLQSRQSRFQALKNETGDTNQDGMKTNKNLLAPPKWRESKQLSWRCQQCGQDLLFLQNVMKMHKRHLIWPIKPERWREEAYFLLCLKMMQRQVFGWCLFFTASRICILLLFLTLDVGVLVLHGNLICEKRF